VASKSSGSIVTGRRSKGTRQHGESNRYTSMGRNGSLIYRDKNSVEGLHSRFYNKIMKKKMILFYFKGCTTSRSYNIGEENRSGWKKRTSSIDCTLSYRKVGTVVVFVGFDPTKRGSTDTKEQGSE
jgi:hypothetical protein